MPSEKFLIAVTGEVATGVPGLKEKMEKAVESGLLKLQPEGVTLITLRMLSGSESAIRQAMEGDRG